jgi:hypothetical protein
MPTIWLPDMEACPPRTSLVLSRKAVFSAIPALLCMSPAHPINIDRRYSPPRPSPASVVMDLRRGISPTQGQARSLIPRNWKRRRAIASANNAICWVVGRVLNPEMKFGDFCPGERLEDVFTTYVNVSPPGEPVKFKVTRHVEQLARSTCSQ